MSICSCRVSPDQKTRSVVRALQARGRVVGFLSAMALTTRQRSAPLTSVFQSTARRPWPARKPRTMILLEHDLGVLRDGVRRRAAHLREHHEVRSPMGASSNFGNMLSMAVASLVLPFLPLTPVQVLVNNLLYDLSETGIPFDSVEPSQIEEPHSWDMHEVLRFTLVMGPVSSVFDLATFALLRLWFDAGVEAFRTAWFIESMATQILVIFVIRSTKPGLGSAPHPILVATSLAALGAGSPPAGTNSSAVELASCRRACLSSRQSVAWSATPIQLVTASELRRSHAVRTP